MRRVFLFFFYIKCFSCLFLFLILYTTVWTWFKNPVSPEPSFWWLWEPRSTFHIFTFKPSCLADLALTNAGNRCIPANASPSCFPALRPLAKSSWWRKATSKKMVVPKNKRVKIPRLKEEFPRNEYMCNNFQIVLTATILSYWLETVFSKRNPSGEIRGNEKLKQCIDGSS